MLFSDAGYFVSTTRIVAQGVTYNTRHILCVRVGPPPPNGLAVNAAVGLVGLAALCASATFLLTRTGSCGDAYTGQNGALIVAGIAFVAAMLVLQQRSAARLHRCVFIGLPAGEVAIVNATNFPWADAFASAIQTAITAR